jgi:hypothetical protein
MIRDKISTELIIESLYMASVAHKSAKKFVMLATLRSGRIVPNHLVKFAGRQARIDMMTFLLSMPDINPTCPDSEEKHHCCLRFAGRQARIDMMTFLLSMPDINPTCPDSEEKHHCILPPGGASLKL